MADKTKIEWTDATWNPITGCSVKSPGCTNCYAMKLAGTRLAPHESRAGLTIDSKAGPVWTGEVRFNKQWLDQPLRWKKHRMIFVCAHGDLFHENVPDEWIDRVFAVMAICPQHTFQVLTKRADRMQKYCDRLRRGFGTAKVAHAISELGFRGASVDFIHRHVKIGHLPNVWLGVSVEDQMRADERIPDLLATPAALRWLSCEPLLGPVNLEEAWHGESALDSECWGDCAWCENGHPPLHNCSAGRQSESDLLKGRSGIDWIVCGGESGQGARPMHPDWARSLRDQCEAAGVPFHFKQWGQWSPDFEDSDIRWVRQWVLPPDALKLDGGPRDIGGCLMAKVGKARAGRLLDGVQHDGVPIDA